MARIVDIIDSKRRGLENSSDELAALVMGYVRGEVPDYQVAAWLMAVCCRGMSNRETADLTRIMAASGRRIDLDVIGRPVVDKHSTGGVGDKTTLVVVPLVAACGVPAAKMSGRGLGHTGGTVDKLESIPGFRTELTAEEFLRVLRTAGAVLAAQSSDLAPADGKIYALRDVTATVESIPLIASSIMSKKLASGAHVLGLDVKVGRGAFMKSEREAIALAETMIAIGRDADRRVVAHITDMDQPLGMAVGNALEVVEAIGALRGDGPDDLVRLARVLAADLVHLAGGAPSYDAALDAVDGALHRGQALEVFRRLVEAQGGDPGAVDDPSLMPRAAIVEAVVAEEDGWVARADALGVARAALVLGAGRERKDEPVDPSVGVVLAAKIGTPVRRGQPLAFIHGNNPRRVQEALALVREAFDVQSGPIEPPPLFRGRLGP